MWKLFDRSTPPMETTNASATAAIRAALYARRESLAMTARDLGAPVNSLHAFIHNGASLSVDILQALTNRIWGGAFRFDPARDVMVPAMSPAPITIPTLPRDPVVRGKTPTSAEVWGQMRTKGPAPKQAPTKPAWLRG